MLPFKRLKFAPSYFIIGMASIPPTGFESEIVASGYVITVLLEFQFQLFFTSARRILS